MPRGSSTFHAELTPESKVGGYYELFARLEKANVTLPKKGTQPSGVVTYGVLPAITALDLSSPDKSRFGIQGTTFTSSGVRLRGDSYNPLYSFLGVKWLYLPLKPQHLMPRKDKEFKPRLHSDEYVGRYKPESEGKFAVLWDMHSVPAWMMKSPTPYTDPSKASVTFDCQKYPPSDYALYGELIEKIAAQAAASREHSFSYMQKNYYQINWEPDWHWLGTDEEFIELYKTAYNAIHKADSNAMLLGANYGVIQKGNALMERLLKKGMGEYMDGLVTHAYSTKWLSPEGSGLVEDMSKAVALTRKYLKPGAPIFQTEWGVPWNGDYTAQDVPRDELLREMAWNLRAHLIILGEGADNTWFFYASDHGKRGFGLIYNLDAVVRCGAVDTAPKPVTMAVSTLTRLLEGTKTIGRIDYLGENVLGYVFKRGDEYLVALWCKDEKSRVVSFDTGVKEVSLVNCMGDSDIVRTENGSISLDLGAIPVYVRGINLNAVPVSLKPITLVEGDQLDSHDVFDNTSTEMSCSFASGSLLIPKIDSTLGIKSYMADRTWLVSQKENKTGMTVKSSVVQVKKKLAVKDMILVDKGYDVVLQNNSIKESPVNLEIRDIKGNLLFQNIYKVAGASEKEIPIINLSRQPSGSVLQAVIYDNSGHRDSMQKDFAGVLVALDRSADVPVIDGDLKDWQLESFTQKQNKEDIAYAKAPWKGPDDLSVRYSLAYDNQFFYFALMVRDQKHLPPLKESEPWRGDSVQIAFGLNLDETGAPAGIKKFSFELDASGHVKIKELSLSPPVPPVILGIPDVKDVSAVVHRDDNNGVTIYEGAISWKAITGNEKKSVTSIGLGAMINDADLADEITGDKRKTMLIGNGPALFNNSPTFQKVPVK